MAEPVSLAQAKAHLRVLHDDEDALISALIVASREWVELKTDHVLSQREFRRTLDSLAGPVHIGQRPLISVDGISYIDAAGDEQPFTGFTTNLAQGLIYASAWPTLGENGYATITYTAGYGEVEAPFHLVQAMLLLIGHWYANREAVASGAANEVPLAVESLCARSMVPLA
ncbi:head-tail connector protein [Sphingobium baderi]|uniref:Phage gp6-like head-tail connector protein n=1 Tax=Sphingobium baderi LL03 TaxID=1114964 RepID=T0HBX1_9SPHN|nr:head-tail connector protein [Sphingobium baderi]EQA96844.1 hypothetical protein L485_22450 [Sphingobium baderi LL03]KMS64140.1 hypothetical protein V475_20350 [Sphingobium baderi LL03]